MYVYGVWQKIANLEKDVGSRKEESQPSEKQSRGLQRARSGPRDQPEQNGIRNEGFHGERGLAIIPLRCMV